jgi:uncharacterized membrane protein HdeD (DUF308 family)
MKNMPDENINQANIDQIAVPKNAPSVIKYFKIWFYIAAVFYFIGGIMILLLGSAFSLFLPSFAALSFVGGLLMIAAGIAYIYFAYYFGKGKEWARIAVIILSAVNVLGGLIATFGGNSGSFISIIISCVIIYYLQFNRAVRDYFK